MVELELVKVLMLKQVMLYKRSTLTLDYLVAENKGHKIDQNFLSNSPITERSISSDCPLILQGFTQILVATFKDITDQC